MRLVAAHQSRDFALQQAVRSQLVDLRYASVGQLRVAVRFTAQGAPATATAFDSVADVVLMRSRSKVIRIAAPRNITAVPDYYPRGWHRSMALAFGAEGVRQTVG